MLDLPRRLPGRSPDLSTDVIVACAAVGLAIVGRAISDMFAPGLMPYVFAFPAVIFAGLIAGARAGLIATAFCQLLIWYFVIPTRRSFEIDMADALGLIVATVSLALTGWAVGAFRSASLRLQEEKEKRVELLSLALREVDHRTKNNFQIAASLLLSHAIRMDDPRVRDELKQAAGRLQSLASVYSNLALSSSGISTVLLHEHLRELCDRIRDGMLPAGVTLGLDADPTEVPAQTAVGIALIVNECLTNAAKHAFPHGVGNVLIRLRGERGALLISIEDDGIGHEPADGGGTGSKLTQLLARSLHASLEIGPRPAPDRGTSCLLSVPLATDAR